MCGFGIGFGVCYESCLGLRKSFFGSTEIFHKVTVVKTALVVAGCILEAEGNLFSFILFPVTFGMKPCVLQSVRSCAEAGYRVVLG